MDTITRTIEFYQILWKKAKKEEYIVEPPNHADKVLSAIGEQGKNKIRVLKRADPKIDSEDLYDVLLEDRTSGKKKEREWAIFKVRKSGLPSKYNTASFKRTQNILSKNEGLDETVHFKIYSGAILVSEYNYYGVRIKNTLSNYINEYLKNKNKDYRCIIKPIVREDVYEIMDKMTKVYSIKIKIATNYAIELSKKHKSFSSIFSSAEGLDEMVLTLTFSIAKGAVGKDKFPLINPLKELINLTKEGKAGDDLKMLKIRGVSEDSNIPETIDFLKDIMKTSKKVTLMDPRQKIVNTVDIFHKIEEAFSENSDYLNGYVKSRS